MMTELEVVSASELVPEEKYVLHYLSQDGNTVQRMNLDGKADAELYSEVSAPGDNDRLFVRSMDGGRFDLYLHQDLGNRKSREVEIRKGFADLAAVDPRIKQGRSEFAEGTDFNFGGVATLAKDSGWKYFVGFWPSSGIEGWVKDGDGEFRYALETPIAAWHVRNAVHLEGDYLVFQLGKDQICILHPESKRIALVARGLGPVVAKLKA